MIGKPGIKKAIGSVAPIRLCCRNGCPAPSRVVIDVRRVLGKEKIVLGVIFRTTRPNGIGEAAEAIASGYLIRTEYGSEASLFL